jgi:hypothetical protein
MNPTGPCFECGPRGYFSFEPAYAPRKKMKLLGVFSGFYEQALVFDATGKVWRASQLRSRYKKSWWLMPLVHTVFNPWVDVEISWEQLRSFQLEELKDLYSRAVDQDDDILTQFVDAPELKKRITAARSFDDLAGVYRWMQTDQPNEE